MHICNGRDLCDDITFSDEAMKVGHRNRDFLFRVTSGMLIFHTSGLCLRTHAQFLYGSQYEPSEWKEPVVPAIISMQKKMVLPYLKPAFHPIVANRSTTIKDEQEPYRISK